MALGTTNITTTLIRNVLGESANAVGHCCISPNINKWSKYKPVRGTWPASANGKYGLDLLSNWEYLQPRGLDYSEGYRMGDFRGYEHSTVLAFPTIQSLLEEDIIHTLNPVGETDDTFNLWKVRIYLNDANNVLITPADLGLTNYYIGVKIWGDHTTLSYKTYFQVSAGVEAGTNVLVQASYMDSTNTYLDLPYGYGTYNYVLFLSSTPTSGWSTTAPSNMITLYDDEVKYNATGNFDVLQFIYCTATPNWASYEHTIDSATPFSVGSSSNFLVNSWPSWVTIMHDTEVVTEDYIAASGETFTVYPNSTNTSYTTDRTGNIHLIIDNDVSITKDIPVTQRHIPAPQSAPSIAVAQSENDNPIVVTWGSVLYATTYTVYRRPYVLEGSWFDQEDEWKELGTTSSTSWSDDIPTVEGLTPPNGTMTFYYQVKANNPAGSGPLSTEVGCVWNASI